MDPAQTDDNNKVIVEKDPVKITLSTELEHVTQEMYKKNAQLSLINKTLSILQKINSIILSSVTDIRQVSQQMADVIVSEAEFKRMTIHILKRDEGLVRLGASDGEAVSRAEYLVKRKFPSEKIVLSNKNNLIAKIIEVPRLHITNNYYEILTPDFTQEEAKLIQETLGVRSIFVYPLVVREEVIGAVSISVGEDAASLSGHELDLMNRLVGVIGIALDNSLLYESIQEVNDRLKELDRLKDEFVSLASHELRTPMTAIKSYVWLLLYGKVGELTEKQKTYLERTYTSTQRLINLVNDMLNISRIESGRLTIEPVPCDIANLVGEVLLEVQARAQEFGINLIYDRPPNALIAKADPDRVKEVIINLIGNSIKFTPRDGKIMINLFTDGRFITVSVKDTGRGVSADDMPKLFKKFNMVGNSHLTKERGQGTGLGLYLSKSLIELHGGKIWVESEGEAKGSTFSFTLPVATAAEAAQVLQHAQAVVRTDLNSDSNPVPSADFPQEQGLKGQIPQASPAEHPTQAPGQPSAPGVDSSMNLPAAPNPQV